MGKTSGSGNQGAASGAALEQVELAKRIFNESAPLKDMAFKELSAILTGQQQLPVTERVQTGTQTIPGAPLPFLMDPSVANAASFNRQAQQSPTVIPIFQDRVVGQRPTIASRLTSAGLEDVAGQFGAARQNIIQGGARGGQLTDRLIQLEQARAAASSGVRTNILANAFQQALGVGTQQPALAFSGLSAGANTLANVGAQQAAIGAQQQAALGQGLGSIIGLSTVGSKGAGGKFA